MFDIHGRVLCFRPYWEAEFGWASPHASFPNMAQGELSICSGEQLFFRALVEWYY